MLLLQGESITNGLTQVNHPPEMPCYASPFGGCLRLPTYRLYRLDGAGRISGADWIEAVDDDEARAKITQAPASVGYELWDRERLVHRFNGRGPSGART
jgi:hypothetical protein